MTQEKQNIDFGTWMKEKRREQKLHQDDLARKANCHTTSIGRWERGEDYPPLDKVEDIVKVFGAVLIIREAGNERIIR